MARRAVTTIDPEPTPTPTPLPVPEVSLEIARREERPSEILREMARAIYVTHPDGVTVDEIAADPRFAGRVEASTISRWCSAGGWVDERKAMWGEAMAKLRAQLLNETVSRIGQVRIEQIKTVDAIRKKLMIDLQTAQARSSEGVAKAMIELMKLELELKNGIAAEIAPSGSSGGGVIDPKNDLTEGEVLDAARVVLQARRKAAKAIGGGGGGT